MAGSAAPAFRRVLAAAGLCASTALPAGVVGGLLGAAALPSGAAYGASPPSGAQLTIVPQGTTVLTFDGQPYQGDLVAAPDGSGVAVVDRLPFEDYLDGIAEMPSNWPAAALEAQAVAARTYALWQVLTHPAGPGGGQICATDACQVYAGLDKPDGPDGSDWVAAVQATRGDVLLYDGDVIEALYGSSDGGQTLYGGVPWLPSVADPQDALSPEHQWSWSRSLPAMARLLGVPTGESLASLVSSTEAVTETLRRPGGSVSTVALPPARFQALLNSRMAPPAGLDLPLPSPRYSVSTADGRVVVDGWGDGDDLGLSQFGALGKALEGWGAAQILSSYYGPARAVALPAGEEPANIGVTLAAGAPAATVGATGPVRVVDAAGRVVATGGAGSWQVIPGPGGVELEPEPGTSPLAPPQTQSDVDPIPRVATAGGKGPAAGSGAGATAGGTSPAAIPDPADPPRLEAAAVDPPGRPARTGIGLGWAAAAVLALLGTSAALVRAVRSRARPSS
jgi:stage II sporulation protein D